MNRQTEIRNMRTAAKDAGFSLVWSREGFWYLFDPETAEELVLGCDVHMDDVLTGIRGLKSILSDGFDV